MLSNVFSSDSTSDAPKILQSILRGGIGAVEEYNRTCKRSIHVFDSSFATSNSDGYLYHYRNSSYQISGYRVIGLLVYGLAGAQLNIPIWYVCSSLSRAEYCGHRNAIPSSLVGVVLNPSGIANPNYFDLSASITPIQPETIATITFSLKDDHFTPITNIRFITIIECIHSIV
jgi:hypothetical protein